LIFEKAVPTWASCSDPKPLKTQGFWRPGVGAITHRVVHIHWNRVTYYVGVGERARVNIPTNAKIIDVQGATVLPGFINAHIHQGHSEQNLKVWAQAGVTTVRDLGASPSVALFARRDALLEDNANARLVAAGPIVTVPDGYPMVPWGMKGLTVTLP
jgi:imidazolonepropionase-like amidohydrolase